MKTGKSKGLKRFAAILLSLAITAAAVPTFELSSFAQEGASVPVSSGTKAERMLSGIEELEAEYSALPEKSIPSSVKLPEGSEVEYSAVLSGDTEYQAGVQKDFSLYLADYLCSDKAAQEYIERKYPLPYRNYVENKRNSPGYLTTVAAYEVATFDGKLNGKTQKAVAYYETILYDTICGGVTGFSPLNSISSIVTSLQSSTFKDIFEYKSDVTDMKLENVEPGTELFEELTDEVIKYDRYKEAFSDISQLKGYIKKCKNFVDAVDKVSKVQALMENKNEISKILDDICANTMNVNLITACGRMQIILEEEYPSVAVMAVLASEASVAEAVDKLLKSAWESILEDVVGAELVIAVKAGQALGKLASGLLFAADKEVEYFYSMNALYDMEDILLKNVQSYRDKYKAGKSPENAKLFIQGFKQLLRTYIEGVDYSKKYAQVHYDKGLINKLFKFARKEEYEELITLLDDIRKVYEDYLEFMDVKAYNDWLYDNRNDNYQFKKKTTDITEDDLVTGIETVSYASRKYYGFVVTKGYQLKEDIETYGESYILGNLDLNEHTLTVHGDLVHCGGQLYVNSGTLNVSGDYTVSSLTHYDAKTDVTYLDSTGTIYTDSALGKINIDGDFIMSSSDETSYAYSRNYFGRGTMTIKGNFYQKCGDDVGEGHPGNFQPNSDFNLVFDGKGEHEVHFDSTSSNMTGVKETNGATIKITGVLAGITLKNDIVISGDMPLNTGYMRLEEHTLTVNGNIIQDGGDMYINDGTLNVKGNYTIKDTTEYNPKTDHTYLVKSGSMVMASALAKVNIDGDFIMSSSNESSYVYSENYFGRGTMTIKGNLYQRSGDGVGEGHPGNFQPTSDFNLVFDGKGEHEVYFDSTASNMTGVKETNGATIKITGVLAGINLKNDIVISGDMPLNTGYMRLEGHTLTVTGNLIQDGGDMLINEGTLNVKGNYTIKSTTEYNPKTDHTYLVKSGSMCITSVLDKVNIDGDFIMSSNDESSYVYSKNYLSMGTMTIKGNFYQRSGDGVGEGHPSNFQPTSDFNLVFDGAGVHEVHFDSTSSNMSGVKETNGATIKITGVLAGITLKNDIVISGDMPLNGGTMNLDGHTLTVNGNVLQDGGNMSLGGGTLDVKGDYTISKGGLSMNEDSLLNVTGDLHVSTGDRQSYPLEGSICIGGGFYQENKDSDNFGKCNANVKFVGSGEHIVSSMNSGTRLYNIILTSGANVTFKGDMYGAAAVEKLSFAPEDDAVVAAEKNTLKSFKNGKTTVKIADSSFNISVEGQLEADINFDNVVNAADIVSLQKFVSGMSKFSNAQLEVSDLNGDGKINVFDVILLRRLVLKKS